MTDTTIDVPDYVTFAARRSIGDVAVITTDLLTEADAAGLALPRYLSMNDHELSLQFGGPDIWAVLAAWADKYGSREDIAVRLCEDSGDGARVHATFTFTHHGVNVELYSFIKANPATT